MGGEGSMLAMIVTLKNNRALLKKRRKMFTKENAQNLNHTHKEMKFKHVSEEKLKQIKLKIRKNKEIENRRLLFVFIALLVLFTGITLIAYFKYITK